MDIQRTRENDRFINSCNKLFSRKVLNTIMHSYITLMKFVFLNFYFILLLKILTLKKMCKNGF